MTDPFPQESWDTTTDAPLSALDAGKLNRLETAVNNVDIQNTKGDLLGHNGTIPVRVPVGTSGQLLSSDPTQAAGLRWIDTQLQSITATDASVSIGGTPQNPTIGVNNIYESQVTGLVTDLAGKTPLQLVTTVQTASFSAAVNTIVLVDISAGGFTGTLPAAPADKSRVTFKVIAASTGRALTIAVGGSDHFTTTTGPTSRTLSLLGEAATMQYQASTGVWLVVAVDLPLSQLDLRYVAQASNSQLVLVNGSVTFNPATATTWFVNLQANATSSTITAPTVANTSVPLTIVWVQDATGGRTYVWPTNCRFAGASAPSDTTANRRTSVTFAWDGTYWVETARAVAVG